MQASVSQHYLLVSPLSAVRLHDQPEAESGFCVLPAGTKVALRGESSISGLIDIMCEGHEYAIFRTDLEDRGEPLVD